MGLLNSIKGALGIYTPRPCTHCGNVINRPRVTRKEVDRYTAVQYREQVSTTKHTSYAQMAGHSQNAIENDLLLAQPFQSETTTTVPVNVTKVRYQYWHSCPTCSAVQWTNYKTEVLR